jgi:hypothetical protein
MYMSMTTAATGDEPAGNATMVAEEMCGWLHGVEGFEGMLMLYKPGTTIGLTFWEGRETAERALPLRMQFLERIAAIADVRIDQIEAFDVASARPIARQVD